MLVECPWCGTTVDGVDSGSYKRGDIEDGSLYTLLKCTLCEEPIVVVQDYLGVFHEHDFGEAWG